MVCSLKVNLQTKLTYNNNGSDKTATINDVFESITPDKEIIDDDTIDINTQWKKLRQECSPMIFEDSEEVRKAASPSYEYTVQHDKYENGSMIVERNLDGSPKEIVQELLQIMLETIANEVVLQREDSSGSSYGIPTDLRENNASPALKTTNSAPLVSEESWISNQNRPKLEKTAVALEMRGNVFQIALYNSMHFCFKSFKSKKHTSYVHIGNDQEPINESLSC